MESPASTSSYLHDGINTICREQLEKMLSSITDVICTIDLQGYFRYVSAASSHLWGYQPDEMMGVSYLNFIVPDDIEKTIQIVADREDNCYTTNFENRYFRKDGTIIPIIWSGRWNEADGLLYCVARDGSEKKEMEARLEKAQQMAGIASLEYDFNQNTFTYLSDTFYTICGVGPSNVATVSPDFFLHLIHPSDQVSIRALFSFPYSLQASKQEYRLQRPDGQVIYIYHQREIIFDVANNPIRSFDTLQDITERKMRELAIQQREERLEFLVQNGSDLIGIINPEGYYSYVADSVKNVLGFETTDLVGKSVFEFIHPDDAGKISASLQNAISSKYLSVPPFRFKNSNNEWRWVETNAANFIDNPAINGIVTNSRDVTERKNTEAELERSEQKFKSLVQNSSDIIVTLDEAGTFKDVSENVSTVLGFDPQFLLNKNAFDYIHPEDAGEVFAELTRVIQNSPEAKGISHRFRKNDGDWIWLESKGINHLNNLLINGIVINSRDVTDRINLQKQLNEEHLNKQREITRAVIKAQETERSQIGLELHDNVNQILTTVKLYNEMFLTGYREDKELLKKSTHYLQECINEIRSISKRLSAPTLGNISLNDSLMELVESINLTNRLDIRYYTQDLEDLTVSQDLHLAIYRIVQEALNNIIKYADASQATIEIKKSKSRLCISIIDNGKGFDHNSKRSGIGLTNMKTRADNLKGSFKIKTAIGQGCTIEICFPI